MSATKFPELKLTSEFTWAIYRKNGDKSVFEIRKKFHNSKTGERTYYEAVLIECGKTHVWNPDKTYRVNYIKGGTINGNEFIINSVGNMFWEPVSME